MTIGFDETQRRVEFCAAWDSRLNRVLDDALGRTGSGNGRTEMEQSELLARISVDPAICHGRPCIRGLRYPVEMILELLSGGMGSDEILADYDDLEPEDILAVFTFAARVSRVKSIQAAAR